MKVITVGVSDAAHFDQRVELEGVTYVLSFHWNARQNLWTLDVGESGEATAVHGVTVVANRPLFARYHYRPGVPPGELIAITSDFTADGPRFDWSNHLLCYITAAEFSTGELEGDDALESGVA
jgi:hypothetical protein